jgi:hypothetical protein
MDEKGRSLKVDRRRKRRRSRSRFLQKATRAYCDDCLRGALGLSGVDVTMSTANFADQRDEGVAVVDTVGVARSTFTRWMTKG